MSLLASLSTDDSIENEKDSVGGGSRLVDSGLYAGTVTHAYITRSTSEALALNVSIATEDGREIRGQMYMTSGKDKGCKNYYEKDGQKHYLPGFNLANSLALLTCGKEISQLDTEQKVIKLYSFDAKAEVPTKVDMVMDLIGKPIIVGVIKQVVDKTAMGDDGKYHPTGETREENEIDKFFRARDKMTTAEIRAQATEAAFYDTWDKKWTGQVKQRATGAARGTAGKPGAPAAAAAGTKKPTTSLFA